METKLIEELRDKTLESIIAKHGTVTGELSKMYLSILDVKVILYDETRKIAQRLFDEIWGEPR